MNLGTKSWVVLYQTVDIQTMRKGMTRNEKKSMKLTNLSSLVMTTSKKYYIHIDFSMITI